MTPRRHIKTAGFTLIEVIVVLLLLGLLTSLAVSGLRSVTNGDLRASSSKLAGAMRFLFDRASTTGKVHRLVMDFEQGKYWTEASDDRFYLPREKESEYTIAKLQEEEDELRAKGLVQDERDEARGKAGPGAALGFGFGASGDSRDKYDIERYMPKPYKRKKARFEAFKETVVKPRTLKGKTKFLGVYSPRMADVQGAGQAYVYFFPLGFAEAAMVYLSDQEEKKAYTLVVHPLTGRVSIHDEYVQPPLDAVYDDEGNEVLQEE